MSTFDAVLFLHVLGAIAFSSGAVVAGVCFEAARRRPEASQVAMLLSLSRVGVVLVLAGAIVAGGCGLWLAHLTDHSFDLEWMWLSAALFLVSLALGALGGRRPRQARRLAGAEAGAGTAGGTPSAQLRRLLDDRASRWANYLSGLAVLGIIYLMVTTPS